MGVRGGLNDKYKAIVAICGIICFTVIELYALSVGFNGVLFATVISAISAIVALCFGVVVGAKQASRGS